MGNEPVVKSAFTTEEITATFYEPKWTQAELNRVEKLFVSEVTTWLRQRVVVLEEIQAKSGRSADHTHKLQSARAELESASQAAREWFFDVLIGVKTVP